ncbi:MAG: hypothetical protein L0Z51_08410 [Candidatus Latescibacteria bacterium]|nr:hypothetical protein [Candidatus Latescibacterota bacterium]
MPLLYGRAPRSPTYRVVYVTFVFTAATASFAQQSFAQNAPPDAPSAPRPNDGTSQQAITLTMTWEGGDPDGDAVTYDVYLGTEADPPLVASGITAHSYQGALLEFATSYWWRVVARDQFGLETSGPVWSFATRENASPIPPFDPNPPNLSVAGPAVTLAWRSGDPDLQPVTYRLFFGTTNPPPTLAVDLTERTYPIDGLQPNTTYYWRVVASDGEFTSSSLIWRFYVLEVPVLISRFDATQAGDGIEVTWEFSSDEPVESATLYRRTMNETLPVPIATVAADVRSFRDETVAPGKTYHYELVVRTVGDDLYRSPIATVTVSAPTLVLRQNHPNPFNPRTTISYDLPLADASQWVRLSIRDVGGRAVRTLVNEVQPGGSHTVVWEGRDDRGETVSSGVYIYMLDVNGERRTRKLVLLK